MRPAILLGGAALVWGMGLAGPGVASAEQTPRPTPHTAAELFQGTTVWNVHLSFTPEHWAALEPKPLAQAPQANILSPSPFLVSRLMEGDKDKSGTLSKEELTALTERWFKEWDAGQRGQLDGQELRDGLNASASIPFKVVDSAGPAGPRRDDMAAAMGLEFQYTHATLEWEGQTFQDVGVRYKGNFSYMQSSQDLKRSLKVELNRHVEGQRLGELDKLNLHSNVVDSSWMNEALSYRMYRDAGVAAPRTSYARVTLTVPGKYDRQLMGLYSIVENVDDAFLREHFQSDKGALFKPFLADLFTDLGDDWAAYERVYYPEGETSPKQRARLIEFSKLVSHASDKDFAAKLEQYLDVDAFARYLSVTTWLVTLDSLLMTGHNFYVELDPRTQKFVFIPWDLDNSFGQSALMRNRDLETLSLKHPWTGTKRFLERVLQVPKFKKAYLARMKELNARVFAPERLAALVDETAAALRPVVAEESESKLARFNQMAAGQPVEPPALKGMGFSSKGKFTTGEPLRPIKPFARARAKSITEQLEGKAKGYVIQISPVGPGLFFAPALLAALDANQDGELSHDEFVQGFSRWFETWSQGLSGPLNPEQLRAGMDKTFAPPNGSADR